MSLWRPRVDDEQWAPVADLMAALMLIFMFIAVIFLRTVVDEERAYDEECEKILQALKSEFIDDFDRWDVDLLSDLTIRFRNPEVLFEVGSAKIRPRYRAVLANFFPRYMAIVQGAKYRDDIREIRIEGHTSSEYKNMSQRHAYLYNMDLSQRRTWEILFFVFELPERRRYEEWARPRITANGLSSSKLIRRSNGTEDRLRSRRVEFRLLTESCQRAGRYESPTSELEQ